MCRRIGKNKAVTSGKINAVAEIGSSALNLVRLQRIRHQGKVSATIHIDTGRIYPFVIEHRPAKPGEIHRLARAAIGEHYNRGMLLLPKGDG